MSEGNMTCSASGGDVEPLAETPDRPCYDAPDLTVTWQAGVGAGSSPRSAKGSASPPRVYVRKIHPMRRLLVLVITASALLSWAPGQVRAAADGQGRGRSGAAPTPSAQPSGPLAEAV